MAVLEGAFLAHDNPASSHVQQLQSSQPHVGRDFVVPVIRSLVRLWRYEATGTKMLTLLCWQLCSGGKRSAAQKSCWLVKFVAAGAVRVWLVQPRRMRVKLPAYLASTPRFAVAGQIRARLGRGRLCHLMLCSVSRWDALLPYLDAPAAHHTLKNPGILLSASSS